VAVHRFEGRYLPTRELGVMEGPSGIPKGLPGVLKPLARAGLGGVFSSNRLPVFHEVLATLRIGALVSLLPALSEHLGACRVVLHLPLHSKVALRLSAGTQE
jgi:hypothetical protein